LKKLVFLTTILLFLSNAICLASPITNQIGGNDGESTVGFTTNGYLYFETSDSNNRVVGLQYVNGQAEFYTQNPINNNFRAIIGVKVTDFQESTLNVDAKIYVGAATINSLNDNLDGYASLIAGYGFQELEIGLNYTLASNSYINLNCRFPADNKNNSNLNIGLITKM